MGIFDFFKRKTEPQSEKRAMPSVGSYESFTLNNALGDLLGSAISLSSAYSLSTYSACVDILATTVASSPLAIKTYVDGKGYIKDDSHFLARMFDGVADSTDGLLWLLMLEAIVRDSINWGKGIAYIERDSQGKIVGLIKLRPQSVRIIKNSKGEWRYVVNVGSGKDETILRPWEVVHIRGMTDDGFLGRSPLTTNKDLLSLGVNSQTFGANFYAKGATTMLVLESDAEYDPAAKAEIVASFRKAFTGAENAFTVGFMPKDVSAKQMSGNLRDAQYTETMKHADLQICRLLGVPPAMVGILEGGTYSNTEQQSLNFYKLRLLPLYRRIEKELEQKLLTEEEKKVYQIRFNADAFLRADLKTRYEAYAIGRQWGFISQNDIFSLEDRPLLEGGDSYLLPLNMVDSSAPSAPAAPSPADPSASRNLAAAAPLLLSAIRRIATKEANAAKTAAKRGNLAEWHQAFKRDEAEALALEAFAPIAEALRALGSPIEASALAEIYVRALEEPTSDALDTLAQTRGEKILPQLLQLLQDSNNDKDS